MKKLLTVVLVSILLFSCFYVSTVKASPTLLTFNSKYVVSSTTAVSTTSTSLVDDTEAVQTFTLSKSKVVLVIYQANSIFSASTASYGMQNAINIDGVDRANSWDSPYGSNYPVRNTIFWVGILESGNHTIKGRFASNSGSTVTINNRVLIIIIFNGDEFYYIDDATTASTSSSSFVDDPYAQLTFTPSASCKALILYNIANTAGATESTYGKKASININGIDYGQAEKSGYSTNYPDSVFTCHALNLSAVSTTVKGRFACSSSGTVTISRRQLAVLLFEDSTFLDISTSTTQVSTTSNSLVDDPQAVLNRITTDTRELLVVAVGTKRYGVSSNNYGECYGINVDGNDRVNSRGSPFGSSYADSAATAWAETLNAGSHTVKGRFSNNYDSVTAIISARQFIALWFSTKNWNDVENWFVNLCAMAWRNVEEWNIQFIVLVCHTIEEWFANFWTLEAIYITTPTIKWGMVFALAVAFGIVFALIFEEGKKK